MSHSIHTRGAAQVPLVGSELKVNIEKLAIGGAGIARHEGLVLFVPDTAPGEEVMVRLTKVKKNFAEAELIKVLAPSPERRTPPCPVAGECGGCNWQHLTEKEQQQQKQLLVLETIRKFNPLLEFDYLPLVPSPRSLHYRNRIQPKYKNGKLGFFARNSHTIVETSQCLIAENALNEHFDEIKKWLKLQNPKGLQKLELYISEDNQVYYGLVNNEDDGVGFSQVNRFQNTDLLQTALEWSKDINTDRIFDLYAGSGNFTLPLAERFPHAKITAVELSQKLVRRGQLKAEQSPQVRFVSSDVETFLKKTVIPPSSLVILDPPRAGTSEPIMRSLAQSGPQKIIYISCHPVSLARDLSWFFTSCKQFGKKAKLARVQAFEMFPQTDHVETIAELRVDS